MSDQQPQVSNIEGRLRQVRRENARVKEQTAIQLEVYARMWEATAAEDPTIMSALEQAKSHRDQADRVRAEADAMHELAETTPSDFPADRRHAFNGLRDSLERQYVMGLDAQEHPEAWGEGALDPRPYAHGLRIIEEMAAE